MISVHTRYSKQTDGQIDIIRRQYRPR